MSILELEPLLDLNGAYVEPHPDREFGLADPDNLLSEDEAEPLAELQAITDGWTEVVDGKRYVLVHHVQNDRRVTSLVSPKGYRRFVAGVQIFENRALSVVEGPDGKFRHEQHLFTDLHVPGRPIKRKEHLETVEALDEEGRLLFRRFRDQAVAAWSRATK